MGCRNRNIHSCFNDSVINFLNPLPYRKTFLRKRTLIVYREVCSFIDPKEKFTTKFTRIRTQCDSCGTHNSCICIINNCFSIKILFFGYFYDASTYVATATTTVLFLNLPLFVWYF